MTENPSNEEIVALIQSCGDESGELRLELLRKNRGFIYNVWKKYSSAIPADDMDGLAFLAVSSAVNTCDTTLNNGFITALNWSLHKEFTTSVHENALFAIWGRYRDDLKVYIRVLHDFVEKNGREPSRQEIMFCTGFSDGYLQEIEKAYNSRYPASLDQPISVTPDGDEVVLGEVIPDTADVGEAVTEKSYRDSLAELFIYILSGLPQEQQTVIRSQYYSGETVKSISCDMGISAAEVRRLSSNAIKTMRMDSRLQHFFAEENVYLRSGLQRFRITSESSTEYSALQLYYQKEGHK